MRQKKMRVSMLTFFERDSPDHQHGAYFYLKYSARIGSAWVNLNYIDRLELIKNLPKSFFDPKTELDVANRFPKIRFEYSIVATEPGEPNTGTLISIKGMFPLQK